MSPAKTTIKRLILTAFIACSVQAVTAEPNILGFSSRVTPQVGIYIKDLATGEVVVDYNSTTPLTPASITKSVTSATAILMLGPDFQFETSVGLSGSRSATDPAEWNGNIVVRASGDPTIGNSHFDSTLALPDSIAAAISRMGIKSITGTIDVIETMADPGELSTWDSSDIVLPYGAGIFGLNYGGNRLVAYPNRGTTEPASDLTFTFKQSNRGSSQHRSIGSKNLVVTGTARNRRNRNWSFTTTNPHPASSFTAALRRKLQAADIAIGTSEAKADDVLTPVYDYYSPSAAEICRSLMKRSDNMFAEGMLRAFEPEGNRKDCLDTEIACLDACGINTESTRILDGSGLTRSNRFSARFISEVLEFMATTEYSDVYLDCFPVAGIDGTLKSFGCNTDLKGRLAMKTGSMRSVQTYAGYRLDDNGQPTHVVVVMVNGFTCSRATLRSHIENFLLQTFEN